MAQNRLLISVVGAALICFAAFHFGVQPKKNQKKDLDTQIAAAQSDLSSAQAQLTTNQSTQNGFKDDYSTIIKLGKAVPGDDDVRSLVVQLDHAAKQAGVNFDSIEVTGGTGVTADPSAAAAVGQLPPGATVGPAGFPVMPFSFTFTGQFFKLSAFFARLDAFVKANNSGKLGVTGRLLTVDALKLNPASSGFPNISATVTATSYLVSPLEGATGGATPSGPAGSSTSTASASTVEPPATTTTTG